jgi:hypothetical protein
MKQPCIATDIKGKRIVYRYKWRFLPYLWLLIFLPFAITLGTIWIRREGISDGLAFLAISLGIVFIVGYMLFLSLSDIEINEHGIARRALLHRWQYLHWSELSRITISSTMNPENGEEVRSFMFYSNSHTSNFLTRRIFFQERRPEMEPMIQAIFGYIDQHRISIRDLTIKAER